MMACERKSNRSSASRNAASNAGEIIATTSKRTHTFDVIDDPTILSSSTPFQNKRLKATSLPVRVRAEEPDHPSTNTSANASLWSLEAVTVNETHRQSHTFEGESSTKHPTAFQSLATSRVARGDDSDDEEELASGDDEIRMITSGMARITIVADQEEEDDKHPANDTFVVGCSKMREMDSQL